MQNHYLAATVLILSLIAFIHRPSLGLLAILIGGTWNIVDYWPDQAVTDPYTIGSLAYNLADVAILLGAGIIIGSFLLKSVTDGRQQT